MGVKSREGSSPSPSTISQFILLWDLKGARRRHRPEKRLSEVEGATAARMADPKSAGPKPQTKGAESLRACHFSVGNEGLEESAAPGNQKDRG